MTMTVFTVMSIINRNSVINDDNNQTNNGKTHIITMMMMTRGDNDDIQCAENIEHDKNNGHQKDKASPKTRVTKDGAKRRTIRMKTEKG